MDSIVKKKKELSLEKRLPTCVQLYMSDLLLGGLGIACVCVIGVAFLSSSLFSADINFLQEKRFTPGKRPVIFVGKDDRLHIGSLLSPGFLFSSPLLFLLGKSVVKPLSSPPIVVDRRNVEDASRLFSPRPLRGCFPTHRPPTDIEDGTRPMFGNTSRGFSPFMAFVLTNLINAVSVSVGNEIWDSVSTPSSPASGFFVFFSTTFLVGVLVSSAFHLLFGFGNSIMAQRRPRVLSRDLVFLLFGVRLPPNEEIVVQDNNGFFAPRLRYNSFSRIYTRPLLDEKQIETAISSD